MSHYTDAAVQAALEALRKPADYTRTEVIVRAVLEAVAPAIVARALRTEAEFVSTLRHCTGKDIAAYLNEQADEIEGK